MAIKDDIEEGVVAWKKPLQEKKEEPETQGEIFSPEGVMIMTIALLFDFLGLLCFVLDLLGIGVPFSFVLDILGLALLGTWTFIHSRKIRTTAKSRKTLQKLLGKIGLAFGLELIPFFGDVAFCWTILVYKELTAKK